MPIRITVNANPTCENGKPRLCRHLLNDVEAEKRKEWNRRRLLRIQQVRQQSKDFANSLREKVHGEQFDCQKESHIKQWQEKTLDSLSDRYKDCLKDIGLAHAKAARQPDPDEVLREERMRNAMITGLRGESAMCLLKYKQQIKKLEEAVPSRCKAYARAKEDLRSNMIAALPLPLPRHKKTSPVKKKFSPVKRKIVTTKPKKQRSILKEIPSNLPEGYVTVVERVPDSCCDTDNGKSTNENNNNNNQLCSQSSQKQINCSPNRKKKASESLTLESKATGLRNSKDDQLGKIRCPEGNSRQRRYSDECHLSDLEDSCYDSDTTWPPRSKRSSTSGGPSTSGHVHCYDHENRHQSSRPVPKSYVQRVTDVSDSCCPRAMHVTQQSAFESNDALCRRKREADQIRRGNEALCRQQRRQDFDRLMTELSRLSREERKLRYTDCIKTSSTLGDTQRKMATKIRQKKMESAFETEFLDPVLEDESKNESTGTPKLNVAEWKRTDCCEPIEVQSAKQNDRLTLSNLMKRINEQREMLFHEIRESKNETETKNKTNEFEDDTNMTRVTYQAESAYLKDRNSPCLVCPDAQRSTDVNNSHTNGVSVRIDVGSKRDNESGGSNFKHQHRNESRDEDLKEKDKQHSPVKVNSPTNSGLNLDGGSCFCESNISEKNKKCDQCSLKIDKKEPVNNFHRRTKPIRCPSPILEVSETSLKQDSREFDADDNDWVDAVETNAIKANKTVENKEKNYVSKQKKCKAKNNGNDEKRSDSNTSLSTLYSLDMALSQVSVERNNDKDEEASNLKGLRISVKVTGSKDYKDKKKKKTKTEAEKILKGCKKLLEDKGNLRKCNTSGETSSTSYRSPPERLSPKQLQLLKNLLKQIEDKPDDKGMPLLKRYIVRLLSMNRESIDRLGVSSSDVSLQSSLVREMVDNLQDSSNSERDPDVVDDCCRDKTMKDAATSCVCCEEKGVQVSLIEGKANETNRSQIEDVREDPPIYDINYKETSAELGACMLDDLDYLTQQINKYFETKQNDKTDEIVKKYMELAKRYTDRISNLADLIGDVSTEVPSSLLRSKSDSTRTTPNQPVPKSPKSCSPIGSQSYNDTSYMTLPPEVKIPVPMGHVQPLERLSPSLFNDNRQDVSWHETLSHPLPTHISPAPEESRWFRPKPPPTMLNHHHNHIDQDMRTSSPHELSTIQEVETPTSWRRRDIPTSSEKRTSNASHSSYCRSGFQHAYRDVQQEVSVPLDNFGLKSAENQKILAEDGSFQTLTSGNSSGSFSELNVSENEILEGSMPDLMQELIQRNIVSSPFGWLKEIDEEKEKDPVQEVEKGKDPVQTEDMADEEARQILRELAGWARNRQPKTRQSEQLSPASSSSADVGPGVYTSTPLSGKPPTRPIMGSETEISAIRLNLSSSSDLALTPPDISLKPPQPPPNSDSNHP